MPPSPPDLSSFSAILQLPFGGFGLRFADEQLTELRFLPPEAPAVPPGTPHARRVTEQICAWLAAPDTAVNVLPTEHGTPFQRAVWKAIRAIPCGQTRTYGELARLVGGSPRAVGQACGANPFPLLTPCHRVVSRQGLGGFANATDGYLLAAKRWLLQNEGAI
ncbi:methylated-DNA--[protein]-cysteine S-methyltransferase [Azoarcus indigens]|uniref:Methylated-DNA-[protein]-cysteine S-methyltransferase n=1 Tax=Azoarcus indigens TaxID=29545 RepID=A0A4R6E7D6_9RHOO|nr:methylated-DNA--[protein]-cysteine S-methyltransferase [Azoarcus indigens]TDN53877.1 methylated-DNA-[protein]-cysteine S-methyltransferase [Azoarcus indigens]